MVRRLFVKCKKNPSKALRGVTRVMRGSKTIGFFFSNDELDEILEDLEALSSPRFQARSSAGDLSQDLTQWILHAIFSPTTAPSSSG